MADCKKCFKCGELKSLDGFYKHPRMADGHLNKCKTCTKNDVSKHRGENLDRIRAYDRERGKSKDRIAANVAVNRAWRSEDLRRQKAHIAVAKAIRKGDLIRLACERCGNEKSLAHHEDYDKPLQVMWLCQPCHKQRHKELKEEF
jgi:ribosomal protein S27AE